MIIALCEKKYINADQEMYLRCRSEDVLKMHAFGSSCLLPWSSVEKLEYTIRRAACLRQQQKEKEKNGSEKKRKAHIYKSL